MAVSSRPDAVSTTTRYFLDPQLIKTPLPFVPTVLSFITQSFACVSCLAARLEAFSCAFFYYYYFINLLLSSVQHAHEH